MGVDDDVCVVVVVGDVCVFFVFVECGVDLMIWDENGAYCLYYVVVVNCVVIVDYLFSVGV